MFLTSLLVMKAESSSAHTSVTERQVPSTLPPDSDQNPKVGFGRSVRIAPLAASEVQLSFE